MWNELPSLPPSAGQAKQPGVASPFVGVHRDALIVAGGANFPEKIPWDGGAKIWWDDIWVLEKTGADFRWVADPKLKLPRRIGYGVSVSTPSGVVCVGGSDAERCYADAFLLAWDRSKKALQMKSLPPMPRPLANMAGALVGDTLYVAGGQHGIGAAPATSVFWALDLSIASRGGPLAWKELPTWPGPARMLPVAAAQRGEFFLFSGRAPRPGAATEIFTDAYAFNPAAGKWRKIANVGGGAGVSVMAGTAAAVGAHEVWLFGGDRGGLFRELEQRDLWIAEMRRKMAAAAAGEQPAFQREIDQHLRAKRTIYEHHPGFGREVYAYHIDRDAWRIVAQSEFAPQVTTTAVNWDDAIFIPSGEVRPGVRTPAIIRVVPAKAKP